MPNLRSTNPIFAIGDIHGQADALDEALARIHDDALSGAPVVFVGDLVDRGPDSRAVIDTLIEGLAEGEPWVVLRGNHDQMFLDFLAGTPTARARFDWLDERLGGRATLAAYGVDTDPARPTEDIRRHAQKAVPRTHVNFLNRLPLSHQTSDHIFVHAGMFPGIPLDEQDPMDLLWIRREFLEDDTDHGRLVVHGHTPVDYPTLLPNRLNVDAGAGFGRPIWPVLLQGRDAWVLTDQGRARL